MHVDAPQTKSSQTRAPRIKALYASILHALRFAASVAALVVVWAVVAAFARSEYLPAPVAVAAFIADDMVHGDMLFNIGMTLWRATAAFVLAMGIGCGLGLLFGRNASADTLFMPWVLVLMNTPVLVIGVLCFIWFRTTEASAILAVVLAKFPNNTVIIRDGVRAFDPGLDDVARIYRFGAWTRLRHLDLPQAMPFVIAAARSGIGIVWKIVLVIELFGLSSGVGFAIAKYFGLFEVKEIIGYSVAFSLVMLMVETLILEPLDTYARRWRIAAA